MSTSAVRAGAALLAVGSLFFPAGARAQVTITPGANTVVAPKVQSDFDDVNPEWVRSVRWRATSGTLGSNIAVQGGTSCQGQALEAWGQS